MYALRGNITRLILTACLPLLLVGCPLKGDNGLGLQLTPDALIFGADEDSLSIQVHRNLTNSPVEPVVVSSSQPWIVPEVCTSDSDNCLGFGLVDRVFIPIRIDRTKMLLGTNRGEIFVRTGGSATKKIDVFAEDRLFVDFRVNNRTPAVGQAVSFEDASEKTDEAGDVVSRLWDFGDNSTSTATDPSHVYSKPGLYSVSLKIVTANTEESSEKTAWITVGSPAPTTDFEATATSIYAGDSVTFSDRSITATEPILRRLWNFGDGRTSTAERPEHQYTRAGAFTVSLTIETANTSRTKTKSNYIIVQRKEAPDARFSVIPSSPIALADANFNDNSVAGSAPILEWFWNFGDGQTSRERNPVHRFARGGDYDVLLSIVTAHGSDTATQRITVTVVPPVASFTISDSTPFVGDTVTFTSTSTAGSAPIEEYIWEFGDSETSVLANPTHVFGSAGTFQVRLTVVSDHGSHTKTIPVVAAYRPPTANFTVSNQSPSVGQSVTFTDLSTPGTVAINEWLWDFGDPDSGAANFSTAQNPSHTYNSDGFYTVKLTVKTPVSSNNTATIVQDAYINVVEAPAPAFTSSAQAATPDLVQFTDTTIVGTEPSSSFVYEWDFGDPASGNNTSAVKNPTHRFSTEGIYTVSLTVHTATRSVKVTRTITIAFIAPVVDFTVESVEDPLRTLILTEGALTTDTLQFNSLVTLGTETNTDTFVYTWDFGDGQFSDLEEPTHSYAAGGSYQVRYTVTTPTKVEFKTHTVEVDAPPVVMFSASPRNSMTNIDIRFRNDSIIGAGQVITSLFWNFGDGNVSPDENPTHKYIRAGSYNVMLTLRFNHAVTNKPMSVSLTSPGYIIISQ